MNGDITGPPGPFDPQPRATRGGGAGRAQAAEPPVAPGISVERLLGSGGGAMVWLVWWDSPDEPDWHLIDGSPPASFALKVSRAAAQDRLPLRSAVAELQALDTLRHEHLVRVYGALETSQGLGLMLEPYSAGSLAALLGSVGRLSLGEVVTVLTPIATALGSLHQGGVVHGDVCPQNILLAADGKPALGGLVDAHILGSFRLGAGTPGFTAPERELEGRLRLGADSATRRSARAGTAAEADVYALAAVAWCALTGSVPARGARRAPLQSLRPELPGPITDLLESALESDPSRRPSAQDFAVRLFRCAAPRELDMAPHVHEEVVPELPTKAPAEPPGRRLIVRAGAAAGVALLLAAIGSVVQDVNTPPTTTLEPASQSAVSSATPDAATEPAPVVESAPSPTRAEREERAESVDDAPAAPQEKLLTGSDPAAAAQGLAVLRTQALREASLATVRAYTVPGAPAREAEEQLVHAFSSSGMSYRGDPVRIRIEEDLTPSTSDTAPSTSEPAPPLVAELLATVTASELRTGDPESQKVVLVLHRSEGKWLLHSVRAAPRLTQEEAHTPPNTPPAPGPEAAPTPDAE